MRSATAERLADIRGIKVTSTPDGQITFRVTLGSSRLRPKTALDLWLDTDADPETGNTTFDDAGGAEYLLQRNSRRRKLPAGTPASASTRQAAGGLRPDRRHALPARRTGATFSINQSELGNTNELNFSAVVGGDPPERAPGTGHLQLLARSRRPSSRGLGTDRARQQGRWQVRRWRRRAHAREPRLQRDRGERVRLRGRAPLRRLDPDRRQVRSSASTTSTTSRGRSWTCRTLSTTSRSWAPAPGMPRG